MKDLIRYGADTLQEDDRGKQYVQAGVDAAAVALSSAYPQFLPYFQAAAKVLGPAAQDAAATAVE